jgi:hypothetical protein
MPSLVASLVASLALALAVALLAPASDAHAATALKEPMTGLEFPGGTTFNGRRYDAARTSHIRTRVLGIGTYAAAVGYYLEADALDRARPVDAQLVAGSAPGLLVLGFVRTVPAEALRELLRPELAARLKDSGDARVQKDVDALLYGIDDMKRGEVIQFSWLPPGNLEMVVKNVTRARVDNPAIARALWEMFLARP